MGATKSLPASIGFRVKTGRAVAVLLAGSPASPQFIERRPVELWDPKVPDSRQPFHAGLELPEGDEASVVRRACAAARAVAVRAVNDLVDDVRRAGHQPRGIALVVSSDSDPAALKNAHVRAHASEGKLFREVLEAGAASVGLPCMVLLEEGIYDRAATPLGRSVDEIKRTVASFGQAVDGPWRAEEKTAALAAWVALARK